MPKTQNLRDLLTELTRTRNFKPKMLEQKVFPSLASTSWNTTWYKGGPGIAFGWYPENLHRIPSA